MSFCQTLFHLYLGHRRIGRQLFRNHVYFHHVYYSKEADDARTSAGVPGYSQLYDVQSFPTLYLLDKDKRIIAKKLTLEQIDEILAYRQNNK